MPGPSTSRSRTACGTWWSPGPSRRETSSPQCGPWPLAINPNTIQRAYEALEREGYLCTVAGKGSFAAERGGINTVRRDALLRQFDAAASELLFLGLTPEELAARLRAAKGKETQA